MTLVKRVRAGPVEGVTGPALTVVPRAVREAPTAVAETFCYGAPGAFETLEAASENSP
jgi:hypothetical protein